jgi:hypothetical protein
VFDLPGAQRGIESLKDIIEAERTLRLQTHEPLALGFAYYFVVGAYGKLWSFVLSGDGLSDFPKNGAYQQSAREFAHGVGRRMRNPLANGFFCQSGMPVSIDVDWAAQPLPQRAASAVIASVTDVRAGAHAECYVVISHQQSIFELKQDPFLIQSAVVNSIRLAVDSHSISFHSAGHNPANREEVRLVQNALQSIALANGLRRGTALWSHDGQSRIASLPLAPHTAYRRSELQAMYEKFEAEIEKLNQRVEEQASERPGARLLMSHPGVGPITALATEVFLGDPARFADSKALASYVGMMPREYSSGGRQQLGGLSKQGNPLLRFLWGEAGAHAARKDPELQRFYRRKLVQKGLGKASVAVARKLGIRLWIMLRDQIEYNEFCRRGQKQQKSSDACAGMPETPNGAKSHRPVD